MKCYEYLKSAKGSMSRILEREKEAGNPLLPVTEFGLENAVTILGISADMKHSNASNNKIHFFIYRQDSNVAEGRYPLELNLGIDNNLGYGDFIIGVVYSIIGKG